MTDVSPETIPAGVLHNVTPVVIEQPAPAAAAPVPAALPGVPLVVAGANAVGLAAASVLEVAGPVGLVGAGAVAGIAAVGEIVRRNVRHGSGRGAARPSAGHQSAGSTVAAALRRAAGGSAGGSSPRSFMGMGGGSGSRPGPGGLRGAVRAADRRAGGSAAGSGGSGSGPAPARTGAAAARTGAVPAPMSGGGRQGAAAGGGKNRTTGPAPAPKDSSPKSPKSPTNAGAKSSKVGLLHRAAGAAADRVTAGSSARNSKAAERSARRTALGVEKARQQKAGPRTAASGQELSKAQVEALRWSSARLGARLAGAAGVAGGVGLLSAVWNWRRPGRALRHMRAVWRRLSARARAARELRDTAIGAVAAPVAPVPAQTVNDPNRSTDRTPAAPGTPGSSRRPVRIGKTNAGVTMSSKPGSFVRLSDAAQEMLTAASTFDPERMEEFQALIDDLPHAMGLVQETIRVLAEKSAESLPVHPAVVAEIGEGYSAMNKVVGALEEVPGVYRRVHADDIERNENPRNGVHSERKWNV